MISSENSDERTLDLRGLKCPLPALKTRRRLQGMKPGATLTIVATDPMAAIDIPHMVRQTGDLLLAQTTLDGQLTFRIQKR
jgi:tRNA 2-thiouridine synthesizing protein A